MISPSIWACEPMRRKPTCSSRSDRSPGSSAGRRQPLYPHRVRQALLDKPAAKEGEAVDVRSWVTGGVRCGHDR